MIGGLQIKLLKGRLANKRQIRFNHMRREALDFGASNPEKGMGEGHLGKTDGF